jgi:hypothetical protein
MEARTSEGFQTFRKDRWSVPLSPRSLREAAVARPAARASRSSSSCFPKRDEELLVPVPWCAPAAQELAVGRGAGAEGAPTALAFGGN